MRLHASVLLVSMAAGALLAWRVRPTDAYPRYTPTAPAPPVRGVGVTERAPPPTPRAHQGDATPPAQRPTERSPRPPAVSRVIAEDRYTCSALSREDDRGRYLSASDLASPAGFIDGDALLAVVNRSPRFALAPSYAPDDLVDVETGLPSRPEECYPPDRQCLRRPAAAALGLLLSGMDLAGERGHIHSAFRAFNAQCEVFLNWAYRRGQGFCAATTASALPGHSQHQLGTAVDLFTRSWADDGPVLRNGFGCSPGGRWLAEHAWEYGFVLPYPMPVDQRAPGETCRPRAHTRDGVDPRTGYSYEPWHLRFVGVEAAARYHSAWLASGPGTGAELTLEQFLRREYGLEGDADLPVCDGCSCGLCATYADRDGVARGPCGGSSLALGADGEPLPEEAPPSLLTATATRTPGGARLVVEVRVARHTVTQPPVLERYPAEGTFDSVAAVPGGVARAYPDLSRAWRLAVSPPGAESHPWRVALRSDSAAAAFNGANLLLPTPEGTVRLTVEVPLARDARTVKVALLQNGETREARELPVAE